MLIPQTKWHRKNLPEILKLFRMIKLSPEAHYRSIVGGGYCSSPLITAFPKLQETRFPRMLIYQ